MKKALITLLLSLSTVCFGYTLTQTGAQVQAILDNAYDSVVTVKQASDLATIDSTKVYVLDGAIDMGNTSIEIPSGGATIVGFSFDASKLTSSQTGYTMFTSPVGGSGNVLFTDIAIEVTGASSQVFDLVGDTGFEATEFNRVNWNGCTSLGTIDTYRQGLESGTGRFGGTPELTLKGTWVGGYFIDTSIVRGLSDFSGSLYKAGAGFSMSSRFRSNQNVDLPASASFFDFSPSNFPNPSTVQLDGCLISRNGVFDATDSNITPNMDRADLPASWSKNTGIENTFVGGEVSISAEATTTVSSAGVFYDVAGTWATNNLQHFDSPAGGQLRHLGTTPIEYKVTGQLVIDSAQNDEVDLKIVVYRSATTNFVDGKITRRVIDRLQGGRDVAYFALSDTIVLNQNDYVKLQVANVNNTADITVENDSFMDISER